MDKSRYVIQEETIKEQTKGNSYSYWKACGEPYATEGEAMAALALRSMLGVGEYDSIEPKSDQARRFSHTRARSGAGIRLVACNTHSCTNMS